MSFAKSIDDWIEEERFKPLNHAILKYLKKHAYGSKNAKSWKEITSALGVSMSKGAFQQGLLKKSRNGNLFIGSNDHGESAGYFLIASRNDARVMMEWYRKRISVEQRHLDHLQQLCDDCSLPQD